MKIRTEDCMSCGQCAEYCDYMAIKLVEKESKGYGQYYIDQEVCIECGNCLSVGCPADAIYQD